MDSSRGQTKRAWRGDPLTVGQLGRLLLNHWVLLIALTLVGAIGGFVAAQVVAPVYTATSTILVKAVPGTSTQANYEAAQYAVARAKAYPTLLYNLTVLEGIRTDLKSTESVVELRDDLTASVVVETPLVQIAAQGATGAEARDKANAAARQLSRFVVQIETINGRSPISVDIAVSAGSPRYPTSPRVPLYVALGGIGGFAIAVLIALIHGYVSAERRSASSVRESAATPHWDDSPPEAAADPSVEASADQEEPFAGEAEATGAKAKSGSDGS